MPADIAQAMPEFALSPPPGSTNIYLQRTSQAPVTMSYFKMSVPRTSLTNFLLASGFSGEFMPVSMGAFGQAAVPLPGALNLQGGLNWASDVRHAAAWDLQKQKGPIKMGVVRTSAKTSPAQQVFLMIYVDDSTSAQAALWFEYLRGPKMQR